jgi:hypothetical protein
MPVFMVSVPLDDLVAGSPSTSRRPARAVDSGVNRNLSFGQLSLADEPVCHATYADRKSVGGGWSIVDNVSGAQRIPRA